MNTTNKTTVKEIVDEFNKANIDLNKAKNNRASAVFELKKLGMTFREISEKLNLSRQRCHQLCSYWSSNKNTLCLKK